MNDLATLTGRPKRLKLGGQFHDVYPLTIDDFGAVQTWVDGQFPDPFDAVNEVVEKGRLVWEDGKPTRVPYSLQQQQFFYRTALEQKNKGRHLLGTSEADEKVQSMEGVKFLLALSIRKGNPSFSDEDAKALYSQMTLGDVAQVYQATNADLVLSDPKATPATTPAGTTTT